MATKKEKALFPFLYLSLALMPLLLVKKGWVVLFLNRFHTPLLDAFFKSASTLGEGAVLIFLALVVVLFMKLKWFFRFLIALLLHCIFIQLFKHFLFYRSKRPVLYFSDTVVRSLNFVRGVQVHELNTFPSGHTTAIFFLMSFFSIYFARKRTSVVLAAIALVVGISRMYLLQHFFTDVYFGMIFGTLSTFIAYRIVRKYYKRNKPLLEKRFFPKIHSGVTQRIPGLKPVFIE